MNFDAFFSGLVRGRVQSHTSILLKHQDKLPMLGGPGYFQIRLKDMSLAFGRNWHQEVVPAAFILADYNYGGKVVRHPFFVSNAMVEGLPAGVKPETLRIRLHNTLVIGPTPYLGGDVGLFVGLFKSVIADRRQDAFSIFEKLFGSLDIVGFSHYLNIANKLSETIFACLGSADIQCVLAERSIVIQSTLPSDNTYLVLLRAANDEVVDTQGLCMHGDELMRLRDGKLTPPGDLDFCVLSIERMAQRDDYAIFPFHALWQQARAKMANRKPEEAQALMLECASQIFASADLSEDHKIGLIEFYQAKLLAVKNLFTEQSGGVILASRSAEIAPARLMQERAMAVQPSVNRKKLNRYFKRIDKLSSILASGLDLAPEPEEVLVGEIHQHLLSRSATTAEDGDAAFLASALVAGSVKF